MRFAAALILSAALLPAEERIDSDANQKIRQEALERSQVMKHLHMLTDRFGPRLTGSPNYEAAAKWTAEQMTEWGLKNAALEPWDFGHPGWSNQRAAGYFIAPVRDNLVFEVLAWTPSTNGPSRGAAVLLTPPEKPTRDDVTAWLDANKDKVSGRIVLYGKPAVVPVSFTAMNKRMDDEAVRKRLEGGARGGPPRPEPAKPDPGRLTTAQLNEKVDAWLIANGALVKVMDAGMAHGRSGHSKPQLRRRPRPSPRSSCATKTTAARLGCWPAAKPSPWSSTSSTTPTPKARPPGTSSPKSPAPTRPPKW